MSDLFEEEEEPSEEDITLAEYGMNPKYIRGFLALNKGKKYLYKDKPTNDFFEFYIAHCNNEEFNMILENIGKFSQKQIEMIDKVDKIKQEQQDLVEQTVNKDESLVSQYIDKNSALIQENETLKNEILTLKGIGREYHRLLKFLYDLMSDKTDFTKEVSKEEIKTIEKIKEVVE